MIDLFIFLSLIFLFTFVVGIFIEKIRVPWIFAALIFGFLLAIYNPFSAITSSTEFGFLSQLGMYFLLFVIGFELDLNKLKKQGVFIIKSTFIIIFIEAIFGTLVVHFVFGYEWFISFVVGLSFATVGEALLIPILDEFKLINTKLGQMIMGVGVLDDIVEIFTLLLVIFLVAPNVTSQYSGPVTIFVALLVLIGLTVGLMKLKKGRAMFNFMSISNVFIFSLFILFLFLAIGEYADATAIAALLSGIVLKSFLPSNKLKSIENEVRTLCYGFFAPLFFVGVGSSMNITYLLSYPMLVLLVVLVSNGSKLLGSWIVGRKKLGTKKSILLGIGLSVKFSTSIIIIKILFENKIIDVGFYSVILASTIVFTFLIPILLSNLLVMWKINGINSSYKK